MGTIKVCWGVILLSLISCSDSYETSEDIQRIVDSTINQQKDVYLIYQQDNKYYSTQTTITERDSFVTFSTPDHSYTYTKNNGFIYMPKCGLIDNSIELLPYLNTKAKVRVGPRVYLKEMIPQMVEYTIKKGDTKAVLLSKGIPEKFIPEIPRIGTIIRYERF